MRLRPLTPEGDIAKRYSKLAIDRQPYLDRGRECAALTLPALLPREGQRNVKIRAPYQGVGARGVNNLASKLLLSLFPPNMPFFRLAIDDFAVAELTQSEEQRGEVEKALGKIERAVAMDVETTALRVPVFEALKHLIVVGNVLLYRDPVTGKSRSIPLSSYVVRRDPLGNVLEIIVREEIALVLLPEDVQQRIKAQDGCSELELCALYTRILRKPTKWEVTQEAGGVPVESATGGYPLDQCPWLPLRMILVDGEDYGRSFVEENYADLMSLEKLTKAIIQFSAAAAKVVFLVKPNATTKPKDLAKAESGDFKTGDKNDIDVLTLEKFSDFQAASRTAEVIEERLSYAFMLNSALQRNGERVTAEEIRRLAQELDTSLGGIHALLAQELQLPLVSIIMAAKQKRRELPKLPKGFVKPMIVTGVEALGRGTDLDNLMLAFQALATIPNAIQRVKGGEAGKRIFAAVQVPSDGLFMTDEEVAAEQQRMAMAEMAKAATPAVAKAAVEGTPAE
ncbi:MAG: hypothetical protein A2882_16300 [Phenylobacterium sp. RIFCSPHIGHO2_01_FULL_70_10]|nr:MAG: hypothetical protein A2882_16300 [Phenylobacterium sp. RIFCSPHIGHO2_01_FULL_70_10]